MRQPLIATRLWQRLSGPAKIGLILGFVGALLTVIGLLLGNLAPLTMRSLLLGILIGGGSWGVVSWAIASAAVDATAPMPGERRHPIATPSRSAAADTAEDAGSAQDGTANGQV
jgi:hypothetical protein